MPDWGGKTKARLHSFSSVGLPHPTPESGRIHLPGLLALCVCVFFFFKLNRHGKPLVLVISTIWS